MYEIFSDWESIYFIHENDSKEISHNHIEISLPVFCLFFFFLMFSGMQTNAGTFYQVQKKKREIFNVTPPFFSYFA